MPSRHRKRIESYWSYEVCHGKHVRQYHEEKETCQKVNLQEYFLGTMSRTHTDSSSETEPSKADESNERPDIDTEVPTKKIEGQLTPYFPIEMGTPCVLKQNKPRSTSVLYVCHPEAKHEILSIAEEDSSPVREETFTSTHKPMAGGGQTQVTVGTTHISRLTDEELIKGFLSGLYCLHGGVGWWKYEFCYEKHVLQYHEDKAHGKSIVVVGSWNHSEHLESAKKNVARTDQFKDEGAQKVKVVSHFYGHGDVCDLPGKPRQVVVKLKCKESESPHAVVVYLLEPQTCQYILGVESPMICKVLDTADENGLLSLPS